MSEQAEYRFDCPNCGESLVVNRSMRDALLEKGCVICGTDLTTAAFSAESAPAE